jgi:hypothetical protein
MSKENNSMTVRDEEMRAGGRSGRRHPTSKLPSIIVASIHHVWLPKFCHCCVHALGVLLIVVSLKTGYPARRTRALYNLGLGLTQVSKKKMINERSRLSRQGGKDVEMRSVDQAEEYARLNPYAPGEGEVLSKGTFQNSQGLLARECQKVPESVIDLDFLQTEVTHLKKHVVIVRFVDSTRNLHVGWLHELQGEIKPGRIVLRKEAGCGYSYIWTDCEATTRRILGLSPHRLQVGMALFHN